MKEKIKVQKVTLLLLAGIVWSIAGFNILRIGIEMYRGNVVWWRLVLSFIIFGLFQVFVFGKMVKKHTKRIMGYEEEKQYFYYFFDKKGFIIMVGMITLGVAVRTFALLPPVWIAVFYTGLGGALFLAGILFFIAYGSSKKAIHTREV